MCRFLLAFCLSWNGENVGWPSNLEAFALSHSPLFFSFKSKKLIKSTTPNQQLVPASP